MSHCALPALVKDVILVYAMCVILVKLFTWQKIIAASQIQLCNRQGSGARQTPVARELASRLRVGTILFGEVLY